MTVADSPTSQPATASRPAASRSSTASAAWLPHFAVYVFVVVPLLALLVAVPVAWGWGLGWVDVTLPLVFYVISGLGITVGYHRYFTHGSFKAKPAAADRAGAGRQHRHAGPGHQLGGRPPPAPRVLRQGGRPALAVAVRHRPGWPSPAASTTRTPGGCSSATRPTRSASPPTCWPTGTSCASTTRSSRCRRPRSLVPGRARRPADLVLVGRADRAVLGRPRAGGPAAPRHLVDQLDLPHDRRPAVRRPGPVAQRVAAGRAELRRVLAQPAPRRPDLRPARRAARPGRHLGPADLDLREARLGAARCAGRPRGGWSG